MTMTGQNGTYDLNKILLIDSSFSVDSLKDKINHYQKIITFDFESHKILSNHKIPHEISDCYLNRAELDEIQKKTYVLSQWSMQQEISTILEYDGVNLGNLVLNDFIDFIAGFLKKFYEAMKITQKYQNHEFVVSNNLFDMVTIYSNKVELAQQKLIIKHETIKHSYRLGQKSVTVTVSKDTYLKLKNITEQFLQKIFRFDKPKVKEKHILLIEFDPTKYKTFFLSSKPNLINLLLYNRRWPAIWNFESFKVIRKSDCRITSYKGLVDNELETKVNQTKHTIRKKLDELWNDDFFISFFSFNGVSFWRAIKPFFEEKLSHKMTEFVMEIELAKKLFVKYHIGSILILSEIGSHEQIMLHLARMNKIPIVLMQHGIPYETKQATERNNLVGFFPNSSDYIITWGNMTMKYVENSGINYSKIKPLGNPVYDDLFNKKNIMKEETILLATSPPMKDLVYDNLVETNERYQNAIENICKVATDLNQKLIIKLHPSLVDFDIESMASRISNRIKIIKSGSIFPLIQHCKLLITFDLSTTILEAQILKKPVISIKLKDYGFGTSEIFNSCLSIPIKDFEHTLKRILSDPEYRMDLVTKGDGFVDMYLANKGTSVKAVFDFLKKF